MSSISMYSKTASLPNSHLYSSYNKQQTSLAITPSANLLEKGTASVFSSYLVSQKVPAQLMNFEPVPQPHFRPPPTIKNLAPTLYDDPAFSADPQSNPFCVTGHDSAWGSNSTLSLGHPTLNFLRRSQHPRTSPDAGQVESDSDDSLLLVQPPNSPDIPSASWAQSSSPFFNPSQGCELPLRPPMTSATASQNSHAPAPARTLQKRPSVRTTVTDKDAKKRSGFLNLFKSPVEKPEATPVIPPRDPRRQSNPAAKQGDTSSVRPPASRHITAPEIHRGSERPVLPARPVSTPAVNLNSNIPSTKIKAANDQSRAYDLDKIDELDETNPSGLHIHHDGPYEAAKSKVKLQTMSHHSSAQFAPYTFIDNGITHYYTPHQPITSSIKLSPGQILPRSYQAHHLAPPPVHNQPHTFDAPLLASHPSEDAPKPRQQQSRPKQTPSAAPINSSRPLVANVSPPRPQEHQKSQTEDPSINIGMSMMYPDTSVDPISIPPKLKHGEPLDEIEEVEEEEYNPYLGHSPVKKPVDIRVQDVSPKDNQGFKSFEDDRDLEEEFRRRQAAGSPVPLHDHTSRLVVANPSDSPLSTTTSPSDTLHRRPSNLPNPYFRAPSPEPIESLPPVAIPPRRDARVKHSPLSYEMEQPQQGVSSHHSDAIQYEDIRHNQQPSQQNVLSHYPDAIQYEDIRHNKQPSQRVPGFLVPYVSDRPTRPEAMRRQSEVIQYEEIWQPLPSPTRPATSSKPHSLTPDEQYRIYRRELERERERDARSTIQSISTNSSGQKPSHPHHVPKRLVMPAPLQQSTAIFTEQVQQHRQSVAFPDQIQQRRSSVVYPEQMKERRNSYYQFSHTPYATRTPSPPGLVSPVSGKYQIPIAQEIPMSGATRKLHKRTSIFGALKGHEAPQIAAVSFPVDAQYMEPPSGDARSTLSKPGRHPKKLLSKRHVDF